MKYLVTIYIANSCDTKGVFNILPYTSCVMEAKSIHQVTGMLMSTMDKNHYIRCASIMEQHHTSDTNQEYYEMKYMIDNAEYDPDADIPVEVSKEKETVEMKKDKNSN